MLDDIRNYEGRLSNAVSGVISDILKELTSSGLKEPTFEQMSGMIRGNVFLGTAADITALYGLSFLGDYTHDIPEIETFIKKNIADNERSFNVAVGGLISARFYKHAVAEWYAKPLPETTQWGLAGMHTLDPQDYVFRAENRRLKDVLDKSSYPYTPLPLDKVVYIVNGEYTAFGNPAKGVSFCTRVAAIYEAWKIVLAETIVAAKRKATPLLWAQTDPASKVILCDSSGNPKLDSSGRPITISAAKQVRDQLATVDNRAFISTDTATKIHTINHETDGAFLITLLKTLERLQLLGFVFPETILATGESGLGNSGLNQGHMSILDLSISETVRQIKLEIIHKIIRPLIIVNFGIQDNYGKFVAREKEAGDRVALFNAIVSAVNTQVFSAADLNVIKRLKNLADIPESTLLVPGLEPLEIEEGAA